MSIESLVWIKKAFVLKYSFVEFSTDCNRLLVVSMAVDLPRASGGFDVIWVEIVAKVHENRQQTKFSHMAKIGSLSLFTDVRNDTNLH